MSNVQQEETPKKLNFCDVSKLPEEPISYLEETDRIIDKVNKEFRDYKRKQEKRQQDAIDRIESYKIQKLREAKQQQYQETVVDARAHP
jgi:vacuolar-type H+-ATPase subunit I/STV1